MDNQKRFYMLCRNRGGRNEKGEVALHLEWERATNSIIDNQILKELKDYRDVIVFGAGDSGEWTVELLRKNGIFPKCYCDNSSRKWGKSKNGLYIKSFEDAVKEYKDAAICIASMWHEEIYKQICEYDNTFSKRLYNVLSSMAWETTDRLYESLEPSYIRDNEAEFERLYQELADEQSKRTLEGLLNYRLTRVPSWLKRIRSSDTPYLDKTIINGDWFEKIANGSIIDGGAFDGDTVEFFIEKLGQGNMLDIHCYEANDKNCEIIEAKMAGKKWGRAHVTLHKAALWDKEGYIHFEGSGFSGHVNEKDSIDKIRAEKIDNCVFTGVGGVQLLKLDIEGAERKALSGAFHTIRRDRPILAICAYHLQDDLLVLSDFIKSLDSNYKLVLRHYMLSAGDSILYGIPK